MHNSSRCSLIALTLFGAFFLSLSAGLAENTAIKPAARGGSCLKRHKSFNERVAQGNVDLVFLGDSITQSWGSAGKGKEVWEQYYADRNAINAGISGERTQHLLWRVENSNLKSAPPKLIVVLIGTNNLPPRNTPEETAGGIIKNVKKLRADLPNTKILLMAILPRGETADDPGRKAAQKVNSMIQKLGEEENVIYLDIREKIIRPDGTISKKILRDYVHPTANGYYIWADAIESYVVKYVGGKKRNMPAAIKKGIDDANSFTSLFNGRNLDGWHTEGGTSTYAVKDNCIVGTVNMKTKMNTFLCTNKEYADFILEIEVKLGDPSCNSGIQFRSHTREDGRVFGYQSEIDPSKRAWTGGIYDEARRGWIYKLDGDKHAEARKAFKRDDWNTIKIQAEGNSIKTWVNGVPCANLTDDKDASGFIGLQVHTGKPGTVMWRNVQIKTLK